MAYIMGATCSAVCMLGYHLQVLHRNSKASFFFFFPLNKTLFFFLLILFLVGLFLVLFFKFHFN